jgi:excisionase family DNA binding protein
MKSPKPLAHTKKTAATILEVGLTKINELIVAGALPTVNIGGCVRIPADALERLAREGDGVPLKRGFNVHEAARVSAMNRAKRALEEAAKTEAGSGEAACTREDA